MMYVVCLSIDEELIIVELCKCRLLWKKMQQSFKKPHRHTTIPFLILLLNFSGKKEAKFENAVDVGKYGTHYGLNTVRPSCKGTLTESQLCSSKTTRSDMTIH